MQHCNVNHDCSLVLLASQLRPTREYRKGEMIYEAGSMPMGIFFVFSGLAASVAVATPAGGVSNLKMRVSGEVAEESL